MPIDFKNATEVYDGLSISNISGIFAGDQDPSAGAGEPAPLASLFLRRATGTLYIKDGPTDIDWSTFTSSNSIWIDQAPNGIYYDDKGVSIGSTATAAFGTGGFAEGYKFAVTHQPEGTNGMFLRAGDNNDTDIVFHIEDQDGSIQIMEVDAGGKFKLGHTTNPLGHNFSMDIRSNSPQTTDGTISTVGYRTTPNNGTTFSSPFFVASLDGQERLFLTDTSRGSKNLSVETFSITWSNNTLSNAAWVKIGRAVDALNGFIMPHNCTIIALTAHCENAGNQTGKGFQIYVDNSIFSITPTFDTNESIINANTLNIDVNQNQKIRVRTVIPTGSPLGDTVVNVWIKWRV